jgi:rod shape-determining protein MreC
MAPKSKRRTGFSRRAQYSTFFAYVAGVVGVLVGVVVLHASLVNHSAFGWARSVASDISAPVGRLAASTREVLDDTGSTLGGYFTWGSTNARLRREVAVARVRQVQLQGLLDENRRLKALLGLAQADPRPVATGWLIASTASSTRRYATISVGRLNGVRADMPVRSALGLVGRVTEAGQVSARVLLLSDAESVVPVRRASDGLPAFATGRNDGTLQIRLLTLGINPLKPGDAFVTSGSGGLYWPGTPIAVVASLTHDGAIGRLLSDPSASEMVEVQPEWRPVDESGLSPAEPVPPPTGKHRK